MTGIEIVAFVVEILDGALKLAQALTSKLDPVEAEVARTRIAQAMESRSAMIAADEAREWAAVPR